MGNRAECVSDKTNNTYCVHHFMDLIGFETTVETLKRLGSFSASQIKTDNQHVPASPLESPELYSKA